MTKLSKKQCRSLVYRYFLREGWLPPGTTVETWPDVTMGDMVIDDPPLPDDPHFQKKRIALDLQNLFFVLGSGLASPLAQLKQEETTLGDLAEWCFENQDGGE
jgi:hypothetical protein